MSRKSNHIGEHYECISFYFWNPESVRENCAKGAIFISKAISIGVLISGLLLFGVPIGSNVKAQSSGQLPPPPVPVIHWLTGDLEDGRAWNDTGYGHYNPYPAWFDISVNHAAAPDWTGDCYYWSDTNGNYEHTNWEQWSEALEYLPGTTFTVRIVRLGHYDHYSGMSWAEATWHAYFPNGNWTKPQTRVSVRDSEGNRYYVDIYINP